MITSARAREEPVDKPDLVREKQPETDAEQAGPERQ
jgi:hypothetical protein